jgi:hypothetical protein
MSAPCSRARVSGGGDAVQYVDVATLESGLDERRAFDDLDVHGEAVGLVDPFHLGGVHRGDGTGGLEPEGDLLVHVALGVRDVVSGRVVVGTVFGIVVGAVVGVCPVNRGIVAGLVLAVVAAAGRDQERERQDREEVQQGLPTNHSDALLRGVRRPTSRQVTLV